MSLNRMSARQAFGFIFSGLGIAGVVAGFVRTLDATTVAASTAGTLTISAAVLIMLCGLMLTRKSASR